MGSLVIYRTRGTPHVGRQAKHRTRSLKVFFSMSQIVHETHTEKINSLLGFLEFRFPGILYFYLLKLAPHTPVTGWVRIELRAPSSTLFGAQ